MDAPGSKGIPISTYKFDHVNDDDRVVFNSSGISGPVDRSSITSHVLFYQSPPTTVGEHTVTATVWNVSEDGPKFYFDFITFEAGDSSDTNDSTRFVLDDDDTSIQYGGTWTRGNTQGEYLNTHHQASADGGTTVTFKWTGKPSIVFFSPSLSSV